MDNQKDAAVEIEHGELAAWKEKKVAEARKLSERICKMGIDYIHFNIPCLSAPISQSSVRPAAEHGARVEEPGFVGVG